VTVDYFNTFVITSSHRGVSDIIAGCYPAASGSLADPNQQYCSYIHRSNGRILFVVDTKPELGTARTGGIDWRIAMPSNRCRALWPPFDGDWLAFYDVN